MTFSWPESWMFGSLSISGFRRPLYQADALVWIVEFLDGATALVGVGGSVLHVWHRYGRRLDV